MTAVVIALAGPADAAICVLLLFIVAALIVVGGGKREHLSARDVLHREGAEMGKRGPT